MWKVVYIAQTKENAQEIQELLTNNGFSALREPFSRISGGYNEKN